MDSSSLNAVESNDIVLNADPFTQSETDDLCVKDDVYLCGRCRSDFLNIDEFIFHKVEVEKCQLIFCPSAKIKDIMIPKFLEDLPVECLNNNTNVPKVEKLNRKAAGKENSDACSKENENVTVSPNLEMVTFLKEVYECQSCRKTFNRQAALKKHIYYEHHENTCNPSPSKSKQPASAKLLSCDVCTAEFKTSATLKVHQKMHNSTKEFRCKYSNCTYTFKTRGSLKRHQRRHTGERPYECDLCGRKFTESGALTRHMRSRVLCMNKTDADLPRYGKRMEDERLGDLIDGSDTAILDDMDHSLAEPLTSRVASVITDDGKNNSDTSGATSMHLTDRNNAQVCNLCDVVCSSLDDLKTHLQCHVGKQYFKCGACNWIASERDALLRHIEDVHRALNTGPPHEVEVTVIVQDQQCNTTTSQLDSDKTAVADSALDSLSVSGDAEVNEVLPTPDEESLLVNSDCLSELPTSSEVPSVRLNQCKYCNRTFRCASYLRLHIRSHTGERPYQCNICKKMFATKDTLRKHMVCHSEERNFKCGVCGKMYKRIAHVREHVRIHTNERPYACSLCNKRFKTTNAMKTHVKTHTDLMPFICPFCLKPFREKASLRRHVRTHTGEKPFSCQHCGRRFAEHGTLSRHMKAKVPCYQLTTGQLSVGQSDQSLLKEVEAAADGATVLTEFSSVVANAQHYIIQTVADGVGDGQENIIAEDGVGGSTSYVILTNDSKLPDGTVVTKLDGDAILIPALSYVDQKQVVAADFSTLVQMEQDKGIGDETQIQGEDTML